MPPEANCDDEEQERDLIDAQRASPSWTQPPEYSQHRSALLQVIDLSTPSEPSEAGDDIAPFGEVLITPIQINESNGPRDTKQIHTQLPKPIVSDSIETSVLESATIESPSMRSRALLSDAPEDASFTTVSHWSWA